LLGLLEQWDVVEVMKLTGHGEGLDEIRKIQLFGEDKITMSVSYFYHSHLIDTYIAELQKAISLDSRKQGKASLT
jgi:hypothetical protein